MSLPFSFDDTVAAALVGSTGHASLTVDAVDTAIALGSGDLPVFATPRMIALMEQAACDAIAGFLSADVTSVGVELDVQHLRPSSLGSKVIAEATVLSVDGARIRFECRVNDLSARDPQQALIGHGSHVRAAVHREAFMRRLG